MFHSMPLALARGRKGTLDMDHSVWIKSSFLVGFFIVFVIPHVGCKIPRLSEMYRLFERGDLLM